MTPMVVIDHLMKEFAGVRAVDDLSLTVNQGDIYGFVGPNGAGKTTTFSILATIMLPDAGSVRIGDVDIRKGDAIRSMIGFMPDSFGVYEDMTVYQYLDFFAAAYYIPSGQRKALIGDVLELTDLAFKRDAMVRALSRGMQQRLGLARVLIHNPQLLILDEPASGLDPRARVELRELLKELAGMGKTILISSHILHELSEMCNRLGIIEQGRLVFEGSREELSKQMISSANIVVQTPAEDTEKAVTLLRRAPFTEAADPVGACISLKVVENFSQLHEIPAYLIENGCRILKFSVEEPSLEDAFMVLTKGKLA